jgi:membrane protease YdiL (CAAX protease family)
VARIPVATALCEEVIFRLAIPDLLKRRRSVLEAELITAALFGMWHILPTMDRLHTNPGTAAIHRRSVVGQLVVVAATVGATSVAGLGFAKLRDMSGSIAAPIIVHAAFNGGGFLGGWLSAQRERKSAAEVTPS